MNDELSKQKRRSLDERFQTRPHVYTRLQRVADMMDEAMAQGCTADQAEAMAIEQIEKLGQELMTDWAEEKQKQSVRRVQERNPQAIKHSKKK